MKTRVPKILPLFICLLILLNAHSLTATQSFSNMSHFFIGENPTTNSYTASGYTVCNAGDIDLNGHPDFLIGAPGHDYDNSAQNSGKVFILYGPINNTTTINLSTVLTYIEETQPFASIGKSMSANGDLNKDLMSDFAIGNYASDTVYLFLGKSTQWSQAKTSDAQLTITYSSQDTQTELGKSICLSGDVNGDGYDDILIGAPKADVQPDQNEGKVFLLLGSSNLANESTLYLANSASVTFLGVSQNANSGEWVTIAPDINGDGYDDILIGSISHVYIIYGKPDGWTGSFSLSLADAIVDGDELGNGIGLSDINGDGYGDFMISAPKAGSNSEGKLYLFYGNSTRYQGQISAIAAHAIFSGASPQENVGVALAAPGDINGDSFSDVLVGSPLYNGNTGLVYGIYGQSTPYSGTITLSTSHHLITHSTTAIKLGSALSGTNDINHDGISEILIGAPSYDGASNTQTNCGITGLTTLSTSATPSAIQSIKILQASEEISTLNSQELFYIEVLGTDAQATTQNSLYVHAYSDTATSPVKIKLTESSSGRFIGQARIVRTRHASKLYQIAADDSDTVYFSPVDNNQIQTTLTVVNGRPSISTINITQIGKGAETQLRIDYRLQDPDEDACHFTENDIEVRATGNDWETATSISSTLSQLTSYVDGYLHTTNRQPLYWSPGNVDGEYEIRLLVRDETQVAKSYTTSAVFRIDNTAPAAPQLSEPSIKNSYQITVTGSAEPLSTVYIYVADEFSLSTNATESGVFSAYPISVSASANRISAISKDAVGNKSTTSNTVSIQFSDLSYQFSDTFSTIELSIPLGASTSDAQIIYQEIATATIQTIHGNPPTHYDYLFAFDLGFEGQLLSSTQFVTGSASVTLNFKTNISPTYSVKICYLADSAWSDSGITLNLVTSQNISFQTNHFTRFIVVRKTDPIIPVISSVKLNSELIITHNFYSGTPVITALLTDNNAISSWNFRITDTEQDWVVTQNSVQSLTEPTINMRIQLQSALSNGTYRLDINAYDTAENGSQFTSSPFKINSTQFNFSAVYGPNPVQFNGQNLVIGYNLSIPADVSITITNILGHKMSEWQHSNTPAGYHAIEWDGLNALSQEVPNGLYYAFCIAKNGNIVKRKKLVIAVLR